VSLYTALRTRLRTDATVSGLVGGGSTTARIYRANPKGLLPQKATMPAVSLLLPVSRVGADGLEVIGPDRVRVQVDCWAATGDGADALAEAVRLRLHRFRGELEGERILGVLMDNQQALPEPDEKLYRIRTDYIVTAAVAVAA
jgi:uncharacterized protein DUF3168